MRRALARLRPAALDEIGLGQAVERLCDDTAEQLDLSVEREIEVPRGLRTAIETALYRIVQEALTNIARHARGATAVRVTIRLSGEHVRVEVEDDGPGVLHEGAPEGVASSGCASARSCSADAARPCRSSPRDAHRGGDPEGALAETAHIAASTS